MADGFRSRVVASVRRTWGAFGSPHGLGVDARYTPAGGGSAVDLRTCPVVQDEVVEAFAPRTLQTTRLFDLLADDVPVRPQKGATIETLSGDDVTAAFDVVETAVSPDSRGVFWRCVVAEAG